MAVLFIMLVAVVAWIAATVAFGYAGLITGALIGVVLAFLAILALTADGLRSQKPTGGH